MIFSMKIIPFLSFSFSAVFSSLSKEKKRQMKEIFPYSSGVMMTRRLGSSPSEWVVTPRKLWSAEWMTRRS